jgi:hypothetical protein
MIGKPIGNDQFAPVEESAARIEDVGHIAFPFVFVRFEQGLAKATDHFGWIIAI